MAIVKFCEKNYNPIICSTKLKIGTLEHYREVDDIFIRDVKELEISKILNAGSGQSLTGNEIGTLTGMSIGGNGNCFFTGNAIKHTTNLPNSFVFCTSIVGKTKNVVSPKYDSYYEILDPSVFSIFLKEKLSKHTGLKFHNIHGPIIYLSEKSVEYRNVVDFFQTHKEIHPSWYLIKMNQSEENPEIKFSTNIEYRFVFIPIDTNGKTVGIPKNPVLLNTDGINGIVKM